MGIFMTVVGFISGGAVLGAAFLLMLVALDEMTSRRAATRRKAQARADDLRRARDQRIKDLAIGTPIEWQDNSHLDPNLLHVKHEGPIDSRNGERP